MSGRAEQFRSEFGAALSAHPARAGDSRDLPPIFLSFTDLFSVEASFLLFLFAGRYKDLPELRSFPVDFTLLFFVVTFYLMVFALVSGKLRAIPLTLPLILLMSFSALATLSLFWSSIDYLNIDKVVRFFMLTSSSFVAGYMLAQDQRRRARLLRLLLWFSCAILAYYAVYRYVLGVNLADKQDASYANNYLEYSGHAQILFVIFLSLAALGSPRQLCGAVIGSSAALFALATIGGRGPFVLALLAIPLLAIGLLWRPGRSLPHLVRLLVLLSALICIAAVGHTTIGEMQYSSDSEGQLNTVQRFNLELSGEDTGSMDERREGREHAFRSWLEKPILGWGIGEFRVQDSYLQYPHNLLLEVLMEIGLLGAFLFFGACAVAVVDCIRTTLERACSWVESTIILLFLSQLVSHLTFQGYLGDDRAFFAYMGMAVALRSNMIRPAWTISSLARNH